MQTADVSEMAILNRAIDPQRASWSAAGAQSLLEIGFSDEDQRRAEALAALAREGRLSESEFTEIENYRRAGRVLELLKAKARISLKGTA